MMLKWFLIIAGTIFILSRLRSYFISTTSKSEDPLVSTNNKKENIKIDWEAEDIEYEEIHNSKDNSD